MEVGRRRTRSQSDAYYRQLHHTIKNPDQQSIQDSSQTNFQIHRSVGHDVITLDDSDVKKPKKVGRPPKKRAPNHDFATLLRENQGDDDDDDDDDVRESSLPLKFKFDDDDDNDDSESGSVDVEKKKKKRKMGRPPKKRAPNLDFASLLRENQGDDVRESSLPLKFKFDDDDNNEQPHKTESEMEIDRLFNDLEVGLWESTNSCVTNDDECSDIVDESRAGRCSRNDHDEFLDEQIGIICRYCHTLLLHIKYVLPPFCVEEANSPERDEWNNRWEESKNFDHDQIQFNTTDSESSTSVPCSRGTVYDLIPTSEKELYPHQLEGFEFMWRNIAGSIHLNNLQTLPPTGGRGCIISHAPGTGKTCLTIVFLQTLLRLYPKSRPLIIAPRGMLLTWDHELTKWKAPIPFHNLNDPKLSDLNHPDRTASPQNRTDYIRFLKIQSWIKGGSILGVGYCLFKELAGNDNFKKTILESPTLVVLDEGHTPRNHESQMWKALTKITTQRRIILSGTPFQNNFHELYNTLSLINPQFSPTNAARDKWANLTKNDQEISNLGEMIQPFVHIYKGNILHKTLPGLKDSLIILKPTPLQQKLLEQNLPRVRNYLDQTHLASLISLHPSLVSHDPAFTDHKTSLKSLESDPKAGVKTQFLINLITISSRIQEKVLIFSEFINPLLHIKKLLKSHFGYNQGREVIYIDGDLTMKQRQGMIASFNDKNGRAKVLLASQRACCEGISLVGASRVVLLDVSWNPSVERQAISRAYRLGQEKVVYVYHLMTLMEVNKYARQKEKDRISELLFRGVGDREEDRGSWREAGREDRVLEAMLRQDRAMFERIVHQPKDSDFVKDFGLFCGS